VRGADAGGAVLADARGRVRLVLVERFGLEQGVRQPVELSAVRGQRGDGLAVAFVDDPAGLAVDELLGGRPDRVCGQRRLLP